MKTKKSIAIALFIVFMLGMSLMFAACGGDPYEGKTVEKLTIVHEADKTTYEQGEVFDPTGLVVNALYDDGAVEENVKFTVNNTNPLRATDFNVILEYKGKTAVQKLKVTWRGNNDIYSVANTPALENSPIKGKTYYFLGSSVTVGSASFQESMVEFLVKRNGCTIIKEAQSATTLRYEMATSYVRRLERYIEKGNYVEKLDAFVCQLSTNDKSTPEKYGEITQADVKNIDAFDKTTTFGAMEYIIALVKETWNCPVVFYTNNNLGEKNYKTMVDALYELKEKWDIGIIDLYNDEEFNDITEEERALWMTDTIHPTKAGYRDWWLPKFEEFLYNI